MSQSHYKFKKIPGGAKSTDGRFKGLLNRNILENPDSYNYNPSFNYVLQKAPAYLLGERTSQNSLIIKSGTNQGIGPGTYKVDRSLDQNYSPKWGIGYGERFTKVKPKALVDEYYLYNSFGKQVDSKFQSLPIISFGKSSRDDISKIAQFREKK